MVPKKAVATAALLGLGATQMSVVQAEPLRAAQEYRIAAQQLGPALKQIASTSNAQILYVDDDVRGKRVSRLSGRFTTDEAMRRVLAGTGLTYSMAGHKVYVIRVATSAREPSDGSGTASGTDGKAQHAGPPAAPAGATDLEEVLVTAQRFSQRLQDVPISITAVSGNQIENAGILNMGDLQKVVPGFQMRYTGVSAQPAIRGVSSSGSGAGDSSNVAIYIDGVYQPFMPSQLFDLPDVDQIEVLKGPQGTLFGRNAAAGAIRVTTMEPSFDALSGRLVASYGSFNDRLFKGFVTAPLSGKVAFSLSGSYEKTDGWIRNITVNRDCGYESLTLRGKVEFRLTADDTVTLIGSYFKRNDNLIFAGNAGPDAVTAGYQYDPYLIVPTDSRHGSQNHYSFADTHGYQAALVYKHTANFGTLTSITSYTRDGSHISPDLDYSSAPIAYADYREPQHAFSEEIDFTSNQDQPIAYSVGTFYFTSNDGYNPLVVYFGPSGSGSSFVEYAKLPVRSAAVYGELYWNVTDNLQLIAGGRYSYEHRESYLSVGSPNLVKVGQRDFHNFSPRASIVYKLTPDANVYYTYSVGFKAGVFSGAESVNPEINRQHEIGFKGRLASNLDLNASAFHIDYKDIQVQTLELCTNNKPNCTLSHFENAAAATLYGAEFDATWRATPELTFNGGLTWLHGSYDNYPNASVTIAAQSVLPNGRHVLMPEPASMDLAGRRTFRTPRLMFNFGANWTREMAVGDLDAHLNVYHSDSQFSDPADIVREPAYTLVDATIGFSPAEADGAVRIAVWGKNLTNSSYVLAPVISANAFGRSYGEPRAFGGTIEYRF